MFEYFVRPHICLSVSVHVAFYFKLGFGREGRGFESGSCFFLFRGVGVCVFFKMEFCWEGVGWRWGGGGGCGWFYFNVLVEYILLRGLFAYYYFSLFCGGTLLMLDDRRGLL